jgi:hypothetical protein
MSIEHGPAPKSAEKDQSEADRIRQQQEEGVDLLRVIGREHLADAESGYEFSDGSPVLGKDFPRVCGPEARPFFVGLGNLAEDDPRRAAVIEMLQQRCDAFFQPASPDETGA